MALRTITDSDCPNNIKAVPYAYGHLLISEPIQHMIYGFGKELLDHLCNRCDKLPLCMYSHELYEALDKPLTQQYKN